MKRRFSILLAVLLLTGCSAPAAPTEPSPPTAPPTAPTVPVLVDHAQVTLHVGAGFHGLIPLGNELLLFGDNQVIRMDPAQGNLLATLDRALPLPDTGLTQVTGEELFYFDTEAGELVTLDKDFQELQRRRLTETFLGDPILNGAGTGLYYCTPAGIRFWDSLTGISRDLKLQAGDWQGIDGLTNEGKWLQATLKASDGGLRHLLVDTANGQTVTENEMIPAITATEDFYCCPTESEWIFGQMGQQPQVLAVDAIPLPTLRAALTAEKTDTGLRLQLYDLVSGKRTAAVEFRGLAQLTGVTVWRGNILFLSEGKLCIWNWHRSPVTDDAVYTAYRYTAQEPDVEGLAALKDRADALEAKYGVEIELWKDVTAHAPAGFVFPEEWRTDVLTAALDDLEAALEKFPAGFMEKAAAWTDSGKIRILLTAGIETAHEGVYATVERMQYLEGKNACIALAANENLQRNFYHTLAHVFDTAILSNSSHFYEWDTVNPWGFRYDSDYEKNLNRTENQYPRYFIDSFSMSFPVEDRATVFEYTMLEGNEAVFGEKYIQRKLSRICKGLREVFGLEEDAYPWEQYLQ